MNIYLDDSKCREYLYPFTLTRHTSEIRIGIFTIKEKWEALTTAKIFTSTDNLPQDCIQIAANIIPTKQNLELLLKLDFDKNLTIENNEIIALNHPWQIFQMNDWALKQDFEILTNGRKSAVISATNKCIDPANIFMEENASVEHCFLNASTGPIYIGKDAVIMEGSMIRGGFAMLDKSCVKMGTKIYGATTLGPASVVGGEIKNTVIFGNSNKAHDGYLGDSVLGEWCNLGAGTSNSNVKNTGAIVKYFLNNSLPEEIAGEKGGLLMGDYSRAAINTSFNTGTVVGVCCNIFGDVSTRKYIPNFAWGNDIYIYEKALRDIENWKKMKGQTVSKNEKELLLQLFNKE